MKIDKSNFEAYFLDYHEGNLDPRQVESLMEFLDSEPGLRAVFDTFEAITAPTPNHVTFDFKSHLKRGTVTPENYEWYYAAYFEGDLGTDERSMVEFFAMEHPGMQKELYRMLQTKLHADYGLVFPQKEAIKRPVMVPLYGTFLRVLRVAAAVLILFAVGFFLMRQPDTNFRLGNRLIGPSQPGRQHTPLIVDNIPDQHAEATPVMGNSPAARTETVQRATPQTAPDGFENLLQHTPRPLIANKMHPISGKIAVVDQAHRPTIEPRVEFAFLHHVGPQGGFPAEEPETGPEQSVDKVLPLSRTLADDLMRIERRLSENRPHSILAIAGASLLELKKLAGSPIQWQTQVDDKGKTVQVVVGNFEISRRTR